MNEVKTLVDRVNKVVSMIDNVKEYTIMAFTQDLNTITTRLRELEHENQALKEEIQRLKRENGERKNIQSKGE